MKYISDKICFCKLPFKNGDFLPTWWCEFFHFIHIKGKLFLNSLLTVPADQPKTTFAANY